MSGNYCLRPYAQCVKEQIHIPHNADCDEDCSCDFICPTEIRLTTLPQQEYILNEQTGFPINVDFTGAVVKAYMLDGDLWEDDTHAQGVIPHSELTYTPTQLIGGIEDPGAYYEATGRLRIVNIQSDHTGGAVTITQGTRYCAILNEGNLMSIVVATPADSERFTYQQSTWNGSSEISVNPNSITYTYNGISYFVSVSQWRSPRPIPYVNYTRIAGTSTAWDYHNTTLLDTALENMFGSGHLCPDNGVVTVSWKSTCDGKSLTANYEVYVH